MEPGVAVAGDQLDHHVAHQEHGVADLRTRDEELVTVVRLPVQVRPPAHGQAHVRSCTEPNQGPYAGCRPRAAGSFRRATNLDHVTTTPRPGWYPDPADDAPADAGYRWWDGTAWTDHTADHAYAPSPDDVIAVGPPRRQSRMVRAVAWTVVVALVLTTSAGALLLLWSGPPSGSGRPARRSRRLGRRPAGRASSAGEHRPGHDGSAAVARTRCPAAPTRCRACWTSSSSPRPPSTRAPTSTRVDGHDLPRLGQRAPGRRLRPRRGLGRDRTQARRQDLRQRLHRGRSRRRLRPRRRRAQRGAGHRAGELSRSPGCPAGTTTSPRSWSGSTTARSWSRSARCPDDASEQVRTLAAASLDSLRVN